MSAAICEPPRASRLAASFARTRGNVLPDRRRSRPSSPSSSWLISSISAKALTGPQPKDVLHAPIFYTICLLSSSLTIHVAVRNLIAGKMAAFAALVAADDCAGRHLPVRYRARMDSPDQRRRPDHQYQSLRHDVLLAGRPACVSRHHGAARPERCGGVLFRSLDFAASTPSGWRSYRCTGTSWMRFGWWSSRLFT